MGGLLPFLLVIISLAIVLAIVIRKFPQLVLLDVDSMPEEKEGKQKEKIIRRKAKERAEKTDKNVLQRLVPVVESAKNIQSSFRGYVRSVAGKAQDAAKNRPKKQKEVEETPQEKRERRKQSRSVLKEADVAYEAGEFDQAERLYLAAIKQSPKSKLAYLGLARVYESHEQLDEAEQTFKFVLKLDKENEEALMHLAKITEDAGRLEEAVRYYERAVLVNDVHASRFAKLFDLLMELKQYEIAAEAIDQALSIEPQNPKYLDNLLDVSVLLSDRDTAEDAYTRLRMVNPENQKLASMRQRIDSI